MAGQGSPTVGVLAALSELFAQARRCFGKAKRFIAWYAARWRLHDLGIDINWVSPYGWTALHTAAVCGRADHVALLCAAGVDANVRDDDGKTPIWVLVHDRLDGSDENLLSTYRQLVARGGDVNIPNKKGVTPLIVAIRDSNFSICGALLKDGADPNCGAAWREHCFATPLHHAVCTDDIALCRLLVSHGAGPAYMPENFAQAGQLTAFQSGVEYGAVDIVRFFIEECGEKPDQQVQAGLRLYDLAEEGSDMQAYLLSLETEDAVCFAVGEGGSVRPGGRMPCPL
jgi:hypothetical protein